MIVAAGAVEERVADHDLCGALDIETTLGVGVSIVESS